MEQQIDQNNEKLIVVEQTSESNNTQNINKDNYSIFNYLKKHPAAVIACFSSMVAIITFMSQFLAYISSKNTLSYWNFDTSYASFNNNNLFYSAIASVVYLLILSFAAIWFSKTCDVYIERKKYFLVIQFFYKKQNHICNDQKKRLKKLKLNQDINQTDICDLEKSLAQAQNDIKKLKAELRKEKRKALFSFSINTFPILILVGIFSSILSFMLATKEDLLKSILVIFLIHISTYCLMFAFQNIVQINRKKLKEDISNKEIENVIDNNKCEKEYPIFSLFIKGDRITNSAFICQTLYIFLVFTVLVFTFAFGFTDNTKTNKDFQITNIDDNLYAVVYYDNDTYYLEKAQIEENTLTIFTEEQRIINTSDISFSVHKFDNVIKKEST